MQATEKPFSSTMEKTLKRMGDYPVHVYRSVFPATLNFLNYYAREALATALGSGAAALNGFSSLESAAVAAAAGAAAPVVAYGVDKMSGPRIENMPDGLPKSFARAAKPVASAVIAASACFGAATGAAVALTPEQDNNDAPDTIMYLKKVESSNPIASGCFRAQNPDTGEEFVLCSPQ